VTADENDDRCVNAGQFPGQDEMRRDLAASSAAGIVEPVHPPEVRGIRRIGIDR